MSEKQQPKQSSAPRLDKRHRRVEEAENNGEESKQTERAKELAQGRGKVIEKKERPASRAKKETEPPPPSPKQPLLEEWVATISAELGEDVIQEAYINQRNNHLLTWVVPPSKWRGVASFLRDDPSFSFDYLRHFAGLDQGEYLEVVVHLHSFIHKHDLCIHVPTPKEEATVPSVTDIWAGADWNEREAYDLLGISFTGHPNLRRILLPDDWTGHPLRKDYEPYDEGI
ncbi:NADH-quinone oxidoreductase subunit C [Mechercharimyces sp. CAU 1602]|uniref:NADH-quinone oxidoreductase subunit C n=1 Tax=Mechercharimyces sp. CAU 1602 TaxID=2973933 RepID=UPI002163228B|nr:NADH-quinone oxidoreductase subunit C [Mechercharimyces sp. CAU 1602]MCS1352275.1 NADH-quinone oxidoreductase subunit C [Mechercharimyces sp. CAU 1602]